MVFLVGNDPKDLEQVEIETIKDLHAYHDNYSIVQIATVFLTLTVKYINDNEETVEEYNDADDARSDFEAYTEDENIEYAILKEVTTNCELYKNQVELASYYKE